MVAAITQTHFERTVSFPGDPLLAAARLASHGFHEDYIVYERAGQWSFASGVLAEVTLDRTGVSLRQGTDAPVLLPWDGAPLRQVQRALDGLVMENWRAYGWAAFELAHAKDGNPERVGDQRLLHLFVPHTEVRCAAGKAQVRSADQETLAAVIAVLADEPEAGAFAPSPLDVRRNGAEDYQRAVELAVKEINSQRLQKVIFSRVVPVEERIDLAATYVNGRRGNNPARSFIIRLAGVEAAGFSPEIVVRVDREGRVVSQPLAGTRALTHDPAEDHRLRAELLQSPKEVYEHAISVQVACEELRQVCDPESVNVEEFMTVLERGSVQHLASRVAGTLSGGHQAWDAFGALFPAVTASGVPKEAACASIMANEVKARGLYGGAIISVDSEGALDAALVLRSVYRMNGMTWLQAGAGIVGQSKPEREFEETCEKLDSVARYLVYEREAV
jgi:salicylate synthase